MNNPKQWKIVPVVATKEMRVAAGDHETWIQDSDGDEIPASLDEYEGGIVWADMLNAAPASPFIMVSREDAEGFARHGDIVRFMEIIEKALEQEIGE